MSAPVNRTLPTLDLSPVLGRADPDWKQVGAELEELLTGEGYVYLTNHGIPKETVAAAFQTTKDFFGLPPEVKSKYMKPTSVVTYHGYSSKFCRDVTRGQKTLIREYFHVWANSGNRSCTYPDEIPGFGPSILELLYAEPTLNLNRVLLLLLSRSLKNSGTPLDSWHEGCLPGSPVKNYSYFSSMFYPELPEGGVKGSSRCSAHTDCSTYTLLFLDQVRGLQKRDFDGQWTDIPTLENGILFIPGDFLEAISGGKFPALVHRVPTNLEKREARHSLPVYILPDNQVKFIPVNSTEQVTFGDYYEKLINDRYFRY